jgi:hypothetical protein
MPIDKPALAGRLAAYLAERAWHEGEPMGLTPADFEDALDQGIGSAFGIHWNTEGELTHDDEQPEPGFLSAWTDRQRTERCKRGSRAVSLDGLKVGRLWRRLGAWASARHIKAGQGGPWPASERS